MSYVGFGAIATLTQEAKDPTMAVIARHDGDAYSAAKVRALQSFIATCIDPSGAAFAGNADNAFYAVAKMAAGPWLMIASARAWLWPRACSLAIAQQNSIAFVMFTMANGVLSKFMAKMNKHDELAAERRHLHHRPVCGAGCCFFSHFMASTWNTRGEDLESSARCPLPCDAERVGHRVLLVPAEAAFGRKGRVHAPGFPALGALVCFAILMSVGTVALVTGVVFILIGIVSATWC